MNYSDYRLSLDIHDEDSGQSLNVKRGDNKSRRIYITLRDGSRPYHISEECYAVFAATKPDGKILYNSCTISDCTIQYEMTGQATNVAGVTECEIRLYGADNQLITSPRFLLIVDETVYDDEKVIDSSDEFTALTELVSEVKDIIGSSIVFVQPDEPADVPIGTLWYDTDEEAVHETRIGEVELLSAKWVGSGNLHSQVVTIDGVTENSQVDLTPSVEQLVVFYEKDLTFLTENDGGVVTVYAIGQKPENDYTMQVTISEVSV